MIDLAAAGVPLVCAQPSGCGAPDDHGFADLLGSIGSQDLSDVRTRELHSIRLRRRAFEMRAEPGTRGEVSVVLATRRPERVAQALEMIARQTLSPIEIVVGLHGDGFDSVVPETSAVRVFRYGEDRLLGDVLQDLTGHARGELITKWDDDDWYGRHHIQDLVAALRYSEADLVGKAAEFVFLEELGVTIRRMALGAETLSSTLAGGALLMTRNILDLVGGWPSTAQGVDLGMIDRVRSGGGRVYRTHGFEYVLRRAGSGHTWTAPASYFVGHAIDQRPGLDLAFAGFDGA